MDPLPAINSELTLPEFFYRLYKKDNVHGGICSASNHAVNSRT
jgi:hypothetical protein